MFCLYDVIIITSERTGETCEASSPEGSCGSLSLFMRIWELNNSDIITLLCHASRKAVSPRGFLYSNYITL